MSLQTRLEAFIAAVGADIKALQAGGGGGGTTVPNLPTAGALDGTELFHVVQGGISEQANIAQVRPWNEQVLTATYVNATVTGTDVFSGFTPAANKKYLIDALLSVQSNAATTGVQTAILGPTTGITRSATKINSASAAGTDLITHISALNTYQVAVAGLTTPNLLYIQSIIEVGATPGAGNIRVGARSEVAISNAVQMFPGSSMRWREM